MRRVFKEIKGEFIEVKMKEIRKGDTFKMYESNGDSVLGNYGEDIFVASSNAYLDSCETYTVDIE